MKYLKVIYKDTIVKNIINFIDVGCAAYMPEPWDVDHYGKYIDKIISFDLLDNELSYLDNEFSNSDIYNHIVFDKDEQRDFYICKRSRVSSLFKPNISLIGSYIDYLNIIRKPKVYHISKYNIEKIEKVDCIRLDTILDKYNISFDFLKTDTEGADFQVIKSLGKYLDTHIVGIHAELYFKEMYKGITLFEEVDDYLVEHGFHMVKEFGGVKGYWNNFLYIREDIDKQKQVDLIKKAYQVKGK